MSLFAFAPVLLLAAASSAHRPSDSGDRILVASGPNTGNPFETGASPVVDSIAPNSQDDIVVRARPRSSPGDPFEATNAESFAITQDVDKAISRPIPLGYKHLFPEPIRDGLRNFGNNLHEPVVFLNLILQLKLGKSAETAARFVINSTAGAAGVFDVAKRHPFKLPRRPNGFADSLGFYGVKPGPFVFLPLIGPTTLRDAVGGILDRLVLPLSIGAPFNSISYNVPTGVVRVLDRRAEFDENLETLRDDSSDPYTARRDLYLKTRQAEIDRLRGKTDPADMQVKPLVETESRSAHRRRHDGSGSYAPQQAYLTAHRGISEPLNGPTCRFAEAPLPLPSFDRTGRAPMGRQQARQRHLSDRLAFPPSHAFALSRFAAPSRVR